MANTFKFGNGNWATKEDSVLAYNDENNNFKPLPFDFTRASTATYVDSDGLIKTASNNEARIDYLGNTNGHLLLEPSRTNLITYSEDFSQNSWNKTSVTITPNEAISPDGTLNATKVIGDGTNGIYSQLNVIGLVSRSIYIKSVVGNVNVILKDPMLTVTSKSLFITEDWQRFELVESNGHGSYSGLWIDDIPSSGIYIWGAQLESGSYATSYIPTSGSSVSRAADTANGAGNSEVFNDSEGVLYADISALEEDGVNKYIAISDGSISNRVNIFYDTSNNLRAFITGLSGTISYGADTSENSKIALKYKSGDIALWYNGFEVKTSTSSISASGLDTFNFDNGGGGSDMYCKTKEVRYFNTALTDAELEYETSYRSLSEMVTELNLNTL